MTRVVVTRTPERSRSAAGKPGQKRTTTIAVNRTKRRRRRGGLTAAWGLITALFTIALLLAEIGLWMVAAVLGGLATGACALAEFSRNGSSTAAPPPVAKPATGKRRPPAKRAGGVNPAHTRKQVCTDACKLSKKPKSTCRCICKGQTHGTKAGVPR